MVSRHPTQPTTSLPPLVRLQTYSLAQITEAIDNLRTIYSPPALTSLPTPRAQPKHLVHDASVPDSGYASADGEEDSDEEENGDGDVLHDPCVLRADTFEREFATRWLTAFTARSDLWVQASERPDEMDARAALVDVAASLLGSFAGANEDEVAVTRSFAFPTLNGEAKDSEVVHVELNDAPLLNNDHTSVGLQSWGSSIRLAERICLNPASYELVKPHRPLRILELGAGTGLLSIAVAKLLASRFPSNATVVATDYHPSVLDNLLDNVAKNFPFSSASSVEVLRLDWQNPEYSGPLVDRFDVILAADVVYHSDHARWIKACVENLLAFPPREHSEEEQARGGVFWLIVPMRPKGGRHEGMADSVESVFPRASESASVKKWEKDLVILNIEVLKKQVGVGRADEGGYKLFRVGWM